MAKRITGMENLDTAEMSYWHAEGSWWLYIPHCGCAALSNHKVTEHPNGTITASPSILLEGHYKGQLSTRHGYLEMGVWRDC